MVEDERHNKLAAVLYLFGMDELRRPIGSHLNSVCDGGFPAELYTKGNFDCARCHATGYDLDSWHPEPASNTRNQQAFIPRMWAVQEGPACSSCAT
jgi:hypothetical protein